MAKKDGSHDKRTDKRGEHLKPYHWKKGQSGNPKGRPKGTGITDRLKEVLFKDDGKVLNELVDLIVESAVRNGDYRFVKEILDRVEGPVKQKIEADINTHYKVHDQDDVEDVM